MARFKENENHHLKIGYLEGRVGNTERLCDSSTLIIQVFEKGSKIVKPVVKFF